MSIIDTMVKFTHIDEILNRCIKESNTEDLIDCIKFLAINLAQYQKLYGKLTSPEIERMLMADTIDDDTARLLTSGLLQAVIALAQVSTKVNVLKELQEEVLFDSDHSLPQSSAVIYDKPAHFRSDRLFYHTSMEADNNGWYFSVRGGRIYGPFATQETANQVLQELIAGYQQQRNTGGR